MTPPAAIRQFINLVGGDLIAKGAGYEEPLRGDPSHVAFLIGQQDYLVWVLRSPLGDITCPFVPGTYDAERWAAGKLRERKDERAAVQAYLHADARNIRL